MEKRIRHIAVKQGLLGAAWCALFGLLALFIPKELFTNMSYDLLFRLKPRVVPSEAVIVYMDDESHRALKQPWFQAWDREVHAKLIEKLSDVGARAIVFDVLFDTRNTNRPAGDQRLIHAAAARGQVFVAGKLDPIVLNGEIIGWKPTPPFAELRAVTTWGLVEAGNPDEIVRKHLRPVDRTSTLVWEVARKNSTNTPPRNLERWMNYYGPPGTIPWVSYHDVVESSFPIMPLISNKVVFVGTLFSVGFTGGKGTDDFTTPYSALSGRKAPGVEINATACLNLLRHDWLQRLPGALEAVTIALMGILLGFAATFLRPWAGVMGWILVAAIVWVGVTYVAFEWHRWFAWAVIAAVEGPVAACWSLVVRYKMSIAQRTELTSELKAARSKRVSPRVQFSASCRSISGAGSSFVVDVWAHLEEQRMEVVRRSQEEASDTEIVPLPARKRVEELRLVVRLFASGLDPQEEELIWRGEITKARFIVNVPKGKESELNDGLAAVYVEGLKVAMLPFSFRDVAVIREQKRPKRVFACYASEDRAEVVARVQGMQKALSDLEVFMDVRSLHSGQDWEEEVQKAILDCDRFYLFWSENARDSAEVTKEWRFALARRGLDFIDPVPLADPHLVPPPKELASKHFNDWTLAYRIKAPKTHGDAG